ncbi:capsular biosynthesis protein [Listeria booriae]|uniref:YveK family protein n=1 Tax=Listeria booriae TaxID=1552123 RepID=UPI00162AD0E5|nr:Wzz/FepE/Etk N-terminal domain-containing protein [Listeria booriae]MBC1292357.1 capsular biosynthesis protein [Listeria booriae]MBC2057641.1 capsular biosynthesis protein [Listeria booriae]
MNEQIDLKKVITVVRRNVWWLVGIIGFMVLGMFLYLQYIATPVFQKDTQILVNQSENSVQSNLNSQTIQADLQLVNTYSAIISSPRILNKVQQELGKKYDIQELAEMIQVKNATDSQVIDISVEHPDPQIAARIANATAQTFTEEIPKIMKIDNVTTLSEAQVFGNELPVKPQKALMLVLAAFIGILVAFAFVFIRLLLNRTFTSQAELEELLGLTVLGEVSDFQNMDLFQTVQPRSKHFKSVTERRR